MCSECAIVEGGRREGHVDHPTGRGRDTPASHSQHSMYGWVHGSLLKSQLWLQVFKSKHRNM